MDSVHHQYNLTVVICGGGHAGHTFAALAGGHPGVELRWLSLSQADRIKQAMGNEVLQVEIPGRVGSIRNTEIAEMRSRPHLITNDPSKCIPGAHVIILSLPACRHAEYFEQIGPYLEKNSTVVGMPGKLGFELQAAKLLGRHRVSCSLLCFETLPWACRIVEFGRCAQVLGVKENIVTSVQAIGGCKHYSDPVSTMQKLLGPLPIIAVADNFFIPNLFTSVHPPIMYAHWKDWDSTPVSAKPLFYQGVSKFAADVVCKCSDEVIEISRAIAKDMPHLDMSGVLHISDWYKKTYPSDVSNWSSFHATLVSCKAYNGLTHPMKELDGTLVPDFDHRYLSEDLPFSLCIVRGIAELVGIKTPAIDEVIRWGQTVMKKEYLVDGSMSGLDVRATRAPQAYGITSLVELVQFCVSEPGASRLNPERFAGA